MIAYAMLSMDLFPFDEAVVVIADSGVNPVCLCVWSMIRSTVVLFSLSLSNAPILVVCIIFISICMQFGFCFEYWLSDEHCCCCYIGPH